MTHTGEAAYHTFMPETADVRVGPSNRVVVPAAVRAVLDIREGDRLEFHVDGQDVRLVSPRTRMAALWAKNTGGDAGDSARDMRADRLADNAAVDARWERIEQDIAADDRDDEVVTADLLHSLGLT